MTHPFRKRLFRQISLNSAAAVRASENSVQLSLIGSRQRAFQRAIDEPHALPLSPQKWLKTRMFTFGVAFHLFAAGNRRHFQFNMYGKSQPTNDKPSLK